MGPNELGGLAARAGARSAATSRRLTDSAIDLLPQTNLASRCARDVLLPTGDVVIQDEFTTGVENYKEFFYTLVGLAGEGQNFDGNGMYVRFQTGGGTHTVSLGVDDRAAPASCSATTSPSRSATGPRYPGQAAAVQADGHLLQADAAEPQRPGRRQDAADRRRPRSPPSNALPLLRKKLRPFGSKKGRREVTRDPQAPARLRGDHRPAGRLADRRRW